MFSLLKADSYCNPTEGLALIYKKTFSEEQLKQLADELRFEILNHNDEYAAQFVAEFLTQSHTFTSYPATLFNSIASLNIKAAASSPSLGHKKLADSFNLVIDSCLNDPSVIKAGVENPALCNSHEFMSLATLSWDKEELPGHLFAKALALTSEEALPRQVFDTLFSLFTDPSNIEPPWEEALALIGNSRLKCTREQMICLLESPDPEIYVTALEREDADLTWQDWQRLSTALKTDVPETINDAVYDLFDISNDIERRVQLKLMSEKPARLFEDKELLFWFVASDEPRVQQCAAHLIEHTDFATNRFSPPLNAEVEDADIGEALWKITQFMKFSERHSSIHQRL